MRIKKILIFHRIKLLRISPYAVLTGVFSSKMVEKSSRKQRIVKSFNINRAT